MDDGKGGKNDPECDNCKDADRKWCRGEDSWNSRLRNHWGYWGKWETKHACSAKKEDFTAALQGKVANAVVGWYDTDRKETVQKNDFRVFGVSQRLKNILEKFADRQGISS